jgi:hypothetical protein
MLVLAVFQRLPVQTAFTYLLDDFVDKSRPALTYVVITTLNFGRLLQQHTVASVLLG